MSHFAPELFCEQAYDEWCAELYDTVYADLWDENKGPARPIRELIKTFTDLSEKKKSEISILDAACGTGNNYVAFSREGYDCWASDGSEAMLDCAKKNCKDVQQDKLIPEPLRWTDSAGYQKHFIERGIAFDLITVNSNSLCHIPPTAEYLGTALRNFQRLLKPGGRLLIDTKRFEQAPPIDGVPIFKELQYKEGKWIIRTTKPGGPQNIEGKGEMYFHTRLTYDVDPCFKVCRALIIVSIYGEQVPLEIKLMPYYPLPAAILEREMQSIDLATKVFEARKPPLDWDYDFVVGRKEL